MQHAPGLPVPRERGDFVPNAFLKFTADGAVHFYCPRDEMGQGVTTGLTTIVAEGLDMAPRRLTVELAGAHRTTLTRAWASRSPAAAPR